MSGGGNPNHDDHGRFAGGGSSDGHAASVPGQSPHEGKSGHFREAGSASLPQQGFTPAKRAGGTDVTGALRVAWGHAQTTGKPSTVTHTGRGGLTLLRGGDKIPYGQSHMVVHSDGTVKKYQPD